MSDKNLPHIQLYIGDWERDCNVLSLQAEMAWLKIIFKMHLAGKQSTCKISAKGLQNLWKTDASGVKEIIQELQFEDICQITEITGGFVFLNRRLEKENSISGERSKAAKSRWRKSKTDAKSLQKSNKSVQNPDNDNDSDNDINEKGRGAGETITAQSLFAHDPLRQVKEDMLQSEMWKEQVRMNLSRNKVRITAEDLDYEIESFIEMIRADGELNKSLVDARKHFNRWILLKLERAMNSKSGKKEINPNEITYKE